MLANLMSLGADIDYGETETELFFILIEKVRLYDPDMLVGYEVQNASWGYLIERAAYLGK
jgi:DNA polymerase zeta